jgi:hypothetical protein
MISLASATLLEAKKIPPKRMAPQKKEVAGKKIGIFLQ